MKVSVSLPEEDVEFLDTYADTEGYPSRSAVLHHAVTSLRRRRLASAYEGAWREWEASEDAEVWDAVVSDGLER